MTPTSRQSPPLPGDATRGRVLALLREGTWTVDDLAARLGLTDNAVRFHLAALESEGGVAKVGVQKGSGAGKPAVLYSLTPAADEAFSRAYAPVLSATVEELRASMTGSQLGAFLARVGQRLAGKKPANSDSLRKRVTGASDLLNSLGGITTVEGSNDGYRIVGRACPLAAAVEADHCVCSVVTALVANVVDAEVRECCDRSGRPKCCFEIATGPNKRAKRRQAAG
ncbi:MAG TPA: helix-turn-helix domain-containing protein [Gemmatimonadaceae bacterium]|jgi:predicted ArsR family transcriptional regulator|nr:helix-turn-helix domain-containing protein [Gemmatimonadaceae bacterium]